MKLSIEQLEEISDDGVRKPDPASFQLPERVLQFGTGVLLRGLTDSIIDNANRHGHFQGRIVVVKSTGTGDTGSFERQDGLYTVCIRGIEHGHKVSENKICSSISRVLSATDHWADILDLASTETIQIIISNTTEVGIQAVEESIHAAPPHSYPGKLLAFLYARYKACQGRASGGLVIIPTELISDNGKKLAAIVTELALFNDLEAGFMDWLKQHNRFCSSLVDRIVPGKPAGLILDQLQKSLGYEDELLVICEAYRLWAIEGPDELAEILTFAGTGRGAHTGHGVGSDHGAVIAPSIEVFKELKLRLLNGTHTLCCGLAFLSGFDTVRDAMEDEDFSEFVETMMMAEITRAIPVPLPEGAAREFGLKVLDRFRNPYLEHRWINITLQYSSKMKLRVVPMLQKIFSPDKVFPGEKAFSGAHREPDPEYMVRGFAAHILFMKPDKQEGGKYWGESRGIHYPINDDHAATYDACWKEPDIERVVRKILSDTSLWDTDLTLLKGFESSVHEQLTLLMEKGGM